MNSSTTFLSPEEPQRHAFFSLRSFLYLTSFLTLWQGGWGNPSLIQFSFLDVPGMAGHESFLFYTFILLIIERVTSGDLTFERSYFSGPMLLMGFALVTSWMHGMFIRQQFTIVYEAHESILIVLAFFIAINVFRTPEERGMLLVFFLFAGIMKSEESVWTKYFTNDPNNGWGTLLLWRDGYLVCMSIIGTFIFLHYKGLL